MLLQKNNFIILLYNLIMYVRTLLNLEICILSYLVHFRYLETFKWIYV